MNACALVPTGHGINCELETCWALRSAGFEKVDAVHLNFLATGQVTVQDYQIIVFPGGFLDGDDLGAAQACANRLKFSLVNERPLIDIILEFIMSGGLVLGICNGFQLLVKLGLLPALEGDYGRRDLSLTGNDSGRFEDRWVYLSADTESPCVFTGGIEKLYLPVRHGEGKIVARDHQVIESLYSNHQVVLRYADPGTFEATMEYPMNPNGSDSAIAGVCDITGRVFGLMPHPEAFLHRTNHPRWTREDLPTEGAGLALFKNALNYLRQA
jgi:phosphoribosylformylglycinamidine synthase subunit PurQ / glutaminase